MSGRPQDSLYYGRARTPPASHPAPGNVGLVLLLIVLLAIVATLALVGPELVAEARRIVHCLDKAQEAACA